MNAELDLDHCFETVTAVAKEAGIVSAVLFCLMFRVGNVHWSNCTCYTSSPDLVLLLCAQNWQCVDNVDNVSYSIEARVKLARSVLISGSNSLYLYVQYGLA